MLREIYFTWFSWSRKFKINIFHVCTLYTLYIFYLCTPCIYFTCVHPVGGAWVLGQTIWVIVISHPRLVQCSTIKSYFLDIGLCTVYTVHCTIAVFYVFLKYSRLPIPQFMGPIVNLRTIDLLKCFYFINWNIVIIQGEP